MTCIRGSIVQKINSLWFCQTTRSIRLFLLLFASLFCTALYHTQASAQSEAVKGTYGAWELRCGRPAGAKNERCALGQRVTSEDRPNIGLDVLFMKKYGMDGHILRIGAPTGILLTKGILLKIDDADIGRAPFYKCTPSSCIAEVEVSNETLQKLQKGTMAVFIIAQTPEAGIGIPIQLNGFNQGFPNVK